jgi:hypothetical protein
VVVLLLLLAQLLTPRGSLASEEGADHRSQLTRFALQRYHGIYGTSRQRKVTREASLACY